MMNNHRGTLILKHTQLVITWPDGREQIFSLVNDVMRIGRDDDSDLAIPMSYRSISRQHLEIRREGMQYIIIDVESGNGVFVNGERVDKAQLADNDEIRIGSEEQEEEFRFRFQLGTESLISAVTANKTDSSTLHLSITAPDELPHMGIRWPNGEVNYFSISTDTTIVGRSPKANLSIPDGYGFVSSRHFELRRNENTFTITDLNKHQRYSA
jgi:pSer/pThr/pTyr-binding forkhead associated (FHA) protein